MPLEGLGVHRSDAPSENAGLISGPTLTLVLEGGKTAVFGGQVLEYRAGQYLIVTVDVPMTSRVVSASAQNPFVAIGLSLRPALIAELLAGEGIPATTPSGSAVGVSDADADLLDAFERLLRLQPGTAEAAVLAPGIEREISWRLLTGEQGRALRALGAGDGRLGGVVRAVEWIRRHMGEEFRAEDVARAAHMSVPTLNRHFKAATALTPLNYQKMLRLHAARLRLLADRPGVAVAGSEVGYGSRSQFSREYRRLFGRSPGRDAAGLGPDE